jgi:anti-sigma B factor antagonist
MDDTADSLTIQSSDLDGALLMVLRGEIDLRSAPALRAHLLEALDDRPARVILDLSAVEYVDSSGVGTMVDFKRRIDKLGAVVLLVGLQERVRSVFEITRLDKFFQIVDNVEQARGR